ncbi:MAG: flippase-like domain-containing protein [Candidatus Omnitrophica bacterium]|nr:flippase-like domain-containing protein [Candidatus Omnitrophota bacterium]
MKIIKFILLAIGFTILYLTVRSVGAENILSNLMAFNWKFLPILVVYPFVFAFDTIGWGYAFPRSLPSHVPHRDLYLIRIIGETLNAVVPWAASLGGEPIKAELLKRRHGVSLSEGYASILIVHTTFWLSLNLFVIGGITANFKSLPLSPILWQSVLAFLISLGLVALLLIIGLHLGIFKKVHALGEMFKWWGAHSGEKRMKFLKLDDEIKRFYTQDPRRFFLSTFFNFLGWFAGVFEVYWISKILGIPMSFGQAWLFEALMQVLRIVTFFIPASIGAQEGGIVLLFLQFGFEKSVGFTFALLRRIREILWLAAGLVLWFFLEDRPRLKTH